MKFLMPVVKPDLKIGDKRTVTKFAYLPKRIGDHIVWLHRYEILLMYGYKYRKECGYLNHSDEEWFKEAAEGGMPNGWEIKELRAL